MSGRNAKSREERQETINLKTGPQISLLVTLRPLAALLLNLQQQQQRQVLRSSQGRSVSRVLLPMVNQKQRCGHTMKGLLVVVDENLFSVISSTMTSPTKLTTSLAISRSSSRPCRNRGS
ncbi:hypothetical protein PABG_02297 [Paracoccidioides brasiliensis Pb03]|nr:hypothetical protein PABG_02297 [Paracoccidioides brasiliensis Pb03]